MSTEPLFYSIGQACRQLDTSRDTVDHTLVYIPHLVVQRPQRTTRLLPRSYIRRLSIYLAGASPDVTRNARNHTQAEWARTELEYVQRQLETFLSSGDDFGLQVVEVVYGITIETLRAWIKEDFMEAQKLPSPKGGYQVTSAELRRVFEWRIPPALRR